MKGKLKVKFRTPAVPALRTAGQSRVGPPLNRSFTQPVAGIPYRPVVGAPTGAFGAVTQPFASSTNPNKRSGSGVGYFR